MDYAAIVAALALIEYMYISMRTGQARSKYDVKAPATTGDPMFERHYRVQMNTLEQLIVFLPALFLFASYVSPIWAAVLGVVFLIGRAMYFTSYIADPEKRGAGFVTGFIATTLLVLGGLIGAILN